MRGVGLWVIVGLAGCAFGQRYPVAARPMPASASAISVRALDVEYSFGPLLTIRLAVAGLDGDTVRIDPQAIRLGSREPLLGGAFFKDSISCDGCSVGALFIVPVEAALFGIGAAAAAIDDRTRLRLREGEQLVVLHFKKVAPEDRDGLELRFDGAVSGGETPAPIVLLAEEEPHLGLEAPSPSSGVLGVFLGGGPTFTRSTPPLRASSWEPTGAQGGIEIYAGWRIGRFSLLGVSRILGVGTLIGVDLRGSVVRTDAFELTALVGYGARWLAAPNQFFAQDGRAGLEALYFLRREDSFGWRPRIFGAGLYAQASMMNIHGELRPAFELGVSLRTF